MGIAVCPCAVPIYFEINTAANGVKDTISSLWPFSKIFAQKVNKQSESFYEVREQSTGCCQDSVYK